MSESPQNLMASPHTPRRRKPAIAGPDRPPQAWGGTPEQLAEAVQALLDRSSLSHEERVQLLGGALVMEALRPHWGDGRSPSDAHGRLRTHDPELADAIEALAPMLLGRAHGRAQAAAALAAVEELLRGRA